LHNDVKLPPNQRPELCPRAKNDQYDGLYEKNQKVLTLGDGDFSFSLSLARGVDRFSKKGGLVATSHESLSTILATYPTAPSILAELKNLGASVMHEVDATDLAACESLERHSFDYILWNFPCIRATGGADGQASEIEENKTLVRLFFRNVGDYLADKGEVHMTHKTIEPFSWWNIPKIAAECGFRLRHTIVFDRFVGSHN
jgi:25S rRNA (uracil2634-N3)-methyltransferase